MEDGDDPAVSVCAVLVWNSLQLCYFICSGEISVDLDSVATRYLTFKGTTRPFGLPLFLLPLSYAFFDHYRLIMKMTVISGIPPVLLRLSLMSPLYIVLRIVCLFRQGLDEQKPNCPF